MNQSINQSITNNEEKKNKRIICLKKTNEKKE